MIERVKKIKKSIWILIVITLIGVFFRTYHFHDWLRFESDQAKDAALAHEVINGNASWPSFGPTVDGTGEGRLFRLGPIYYWFQIISEKIFGDYPDKLAYPDLLFSILSIPLFYFLLKKYFSENLSLALTGLYSISFFSIQYSRFAWNPNLIPFFVILFLLSLYEFVIKKEKTAWFWVVMLGIALGVGIQLHGLILFIFPVAAFFVLVFSMKESKRVWKKWMIVFAIFLALNLGQLISEIKTNFTNSKILINYILNKPVKMSQKSNQMLNIGKGIDCQIEANAYILSSFGQGSCSLDLIRLTIGERSDGIVKSLKNPIFFIGLFASFIFSFFGYLFLIYNCKKEKEKNKKYFLWLVALYLGIAFLIMLAGGHFNFRYFNCVFFAPFMVLGFLTTYLSKKAMRIHWAIFAPLFLLIIASNLISLLYAAKELSEKKKTGYNSSFLVQIEPIAQYLAANSNGKKNISLDGKDAIMQNYYPLVYFMEKQGIILIRKSESNIDSPVDMPEFYMSTRALDNFNSEKIGQIYISKIKN
jgi:hypothetical protein